MTFFAGDEVSALILDVGSSSVKAGYAGEDTPKAVFPSFVGVLHQSGEGELGSGPMAIDEGEGAPMSLANETKIKYFCGINQLGRRDGMEMEPAMKDGLVHNWDALEKLWDHALCERLGMRPREHPVLLTEPSFNTKEIREKFTEIFFEKYDVPAFFVAKEPVCSCFANGRSTGLVLDIGAEITSITPVHDGYALRKGITRSSLAGDRLSDEFLYQILNKGQTVLPRYATKRKPVAGGKFEIHTLDFPHTTVSYRNFMIRRVMNDLKETTGRVSEAPFDDQTMTNIPSVEYDLPNGVIEVGNERFSIPECLFRPEGLHDQSNIASEGALVGLHQMAFQSAKKCDVDLLKELLNNIIICGGGSLITGFSDRFQREISSLATLPKLRVIASSTTVERNFSTWLGGSILGSLGSFQQMWISKEEYGDFGKSLVERKCP